MRFALFLVFSPEGRKMKGNFKVNFKGYRARQGQPVDQADLRSHCVSVRLNKSELADLDERREGTGMQRGEWLRAAALSAVPTPIPPLNRQAWAELARSSANLNQLTRHLNESAGADSQTVLAMAELKTFRLALISAKTEAQVIHHAPEGAPE